MAFNPLDLTLPAGVESSKLKCLYEFDSSVLGFNDRSPNGIHLSRQGTYSNLFSRMQQGEGVWCNAPSAWAQSTTTHTGVFDTLGELTVEWIGMRWGSTNDRQYFFFTGLTGSSAESTNGFAVWIDPSNGGRLTIMHENGAGVFIEAESEWCMNHMGLHYGALTRAADGVTYKLYSDGELLETIVLSDPQTGGTGGRRLYLLGTGSTRELLMCLDSFRICTNVEFSLAQIRGVYDRLHVSR